MSGTLVACGRVSDLQSGGCRFDSRPGLLRTKVYSAFHPSRVGKWVPATAVKAKAGMAHSDCGWTCGCAGKTVKSLENMCHTWALLRWWFTTKRRYIKCMHLYLYLCTKHESYKIKQAMRPGAWDILPILHNIPLQVMTWTATQSLQIGGHHACQWCGSSYSIRIPSLNFE